MTPDLQQWVQPAPPQGLALAARALQAETFELAAARDLPTTTPGTNTTYGCLVGLNAGRTVQGIINLCQTSAGAGLTLAKMGLADKNGNMLGVTADFHASLVTSFNVVPLLAPVAIPASDGYYLCFFSVWATTGPSLVRSVAGGPSGIALNGGKPLTTSASGQVDLVTFAPFPATGIGWWLAAY